MELSGGDVDRRTGEGQDGRGAGGGCKDRLKLVRIRVALVPARSVNAKRKKKVWYKSKLG